MAFKLKSGNKISFKNLGSSPAKTTHKAENKRKEELLNQGFTPEDADKMIKDKAVTGKVQHEFTQQKQQSSGKDKIAPMQISELGKKVKAQKAFKAWEKSSKGATRFLENRAKVLKILKNQKGGKTKSPAKQTDSTWADGTEKSKRQIAEQKIHPDEYWYKINGKKSTKAQYLTYKNKPGGDEPGKQTNDPDASGNKAKITKDRASRDWKPAYEGGDYSKEDLRKMTTKQRKKIEKGQE